MEADNTCYDQERVSWKSLLSKETLQKLVSSSIANFMPGEMKQE
jgi:hypothetical protein